jgi:uncharacterized repeat protein (TIGR03803 family)
MRIEFSAIGFAAALLCSFAAVPSASAQTFTALHKFCVDDVCSDGANPLQSALVQDAAGNFYGTAQNGGANGGGVLYELVGGNKYKSVFNFPAGVGPRGTLVQDADGNLYGVANGSTGLVFRLHPHAKKTKWSYETIYTFCPNGPSGCTDGTVPVTLTYAGAATGLTYDGRAALYGSTEFGGTGSSTLGTIFQLTPGKSGWREKIIYSFCTVANCGDGAFPSYGLIADASGTLYGTTTGGGTTANPQGVVFKLTPNSKQTKWTQTVLHSFCADVNCTDGSGPSGLVMDGASNLYGTAQSGGDASGGFSGGTIYRVSAAGQFTRLYSFCQQEGCADGDGPVASMTLDPSGLLYGVTAGDSRVFSFNPSTSAYTVLHTFCTTTKCHDGFSLASPLALDTSGTLYGSAGLGGNKLEGGTVFKLTP